MVSCVCSVFICLSLCFSFRTVVFSWMTKRATAVIHWKATCSATAATSTDCNRRSLPTRPPATPSMSLSCEGGGQQPSPASHVIKDTSSGQKKGLHPLQQFQEALCGRLSICPLTNRTWTNTHSTAPTTRPVCGGPRKKGPPAPPLVVLYCPRPLWCLTLKAHTLAHPEAPGDVTPPDPCTFIKERVFGM